MLSVKRPFKIIKDNVYVICDGYTLRDLRMDLRTGEIFIIVDFYLEAEIHFTKEYKVGIAGDVDVNKLIDELHIKLDYEFSSK